MNLMSTIKEFIEHNYDCYWKDDIYGYDLRYHIYEKQKKIFLAATLYNSMDWVEMKSLSKEITLNCELDTVFEELQTEILSWASNNILEENKKDTNSNHPQSEIPF